LPSWSASQLLRTLRYNALIVDRKDIQASCDDIVQQFAPRKVILFGSSAYGTPTEDSDVDLLVIS